MLARAVTQAVDLAGGFVLGDQRPERVRPGVVHHAEARLDLEMVVARQERIKKRALLWEQHVAVERVARIVVREIDVVEMHPHAWLEARQHLVDQIVHFAARAHGMRRIDEQQIARL